MSLLTGEARLGGIIAVLTNTCLMLNDYQKRYGHCKFGLMPRVTEYEYTSGETPEAWKRPRPDQTGMI